jgi:hypothetical protein
LQQTALAVILQPIASRSRTLAYILAVCRGAFLAAMVRKTWFFVKNCPGVEEDLAGEDKMMLDNFVHAVRKTKVAHVIGLSKGEMMSGHYRIRDLIVILSTPGFA